MTPQIQARHEVTLAARAFAKLGYLHAFGHISVRFGAGLLITPTRPPFLAQQASDVLEVDFDGNVREGDASARPVEVFLHIAIYQQRTDVNAVCRSHAPHATVIQSAAAVPPIRHGLAGIAETIAVFDEIDLVSNADIGLRAARCLGGSHAMVLRGNGVISVGASLGDAAARTWSLEERCAFDKLCGGKGTAFSALELEARKRWYGIEAQRTWAWMQYLGAQ